MTIATDQDIDESLVTDDAHFIRDISLDSMALLEVLVMMEKKFGVSIPESELPNITTITKCTQIVGKYFQDKGLSVTGDLSVT